MYVDFVHFALWLNDYDKLASRVSRVLDDIADDHDRCKMLEIFVQHITNRDDLYDKSYFFQDGPNASITIEDLAACATHASDAAKLLQTSAKKAQQQLSAHFIHILEKLKPQTWASHMRDAGTIAFFIKYLDREDLG